MTDNANTSASKAPTHIAYHVRETGEGQNKKSYWTRIGAAWPHRDGKGFNADFDLFPRDGRVSFRIAEDKKD